MLIAVAALSVWVARNLYWAEFEVPTPLRGEAAVNPFYAAERFTERLGARAEWDCVLTLPDADAVLVVSDWRWSLSTPRAQAMQAWVEQGGRLVVDRTVLGDTAFENWSGIHIRRPRPASTRSGPRVVTSPCRSLVPIADGNTDPTMPSGFRLCDSQPGTGLDTSAPSEWALGDALGSQVGRVRVGRGTVTAINAVPFTERQLFAGDHAALLVAASRLREGDDVRFLSETDYPSLLTLMWQRGWPVVIVLLAAVAVWLWRVGVRFGPPTAPVVVARRSLEEQIRGTGDFTRRYGAGAPLVRATVRALDEAARRAIPGYAALHGDARLTALAAASGTTHDALAAAIDAGDEPHHAADAIHTLETARRALQRRHTRT
ncbi:MAG: DUF4350 domain-containing protein [Vicinamibacterales bacterium]